MSAEATTTTDPRWGELITLMGWPWKLALALVALGSALLLPRPGFMFPLDAARDEGLALACLGGAALLALGNSLHALRALLRGTAEDPATGPMEAQALIGGLRRLLEEQRLQVHEATGAASRAVASAAQLSGLASHVEKQFRQTLERVVPVAESVSSAALPARLETALEKWEAGIPQEAALARMEACARQVEAAGETLLTLPDLVQQAVARQAAAPAVPGMEQIGQAVRRLERAAGVLEHLPEHTQALQAATQAMVEQGGGVPAGRLEELVRSLGAHVERVLRNEANLGDAARYLTETTDRFSDGLAALETHAVRLQAVVSIAGQREAEGSPLCHEMTGLRQQVEAIQRQLGRMQALPPGLHATLERLGAVEADAAQLLQEAAAMSPPAFASRTAKLLQSMQENLRHLQATATDSSQAA